MWGDVCQDDFTLIEGAGEEHLRRAAVLFGLAWLVVPMNHKQVTFQIDVGLLDLFLVQYQIAA